MKKISISDAFRGCDGITIPNELDTNTMIYPIPFGQSIKEDGLLFIPDGINEITHETDISALRVTPSAIVASRKRNIIGANCPIIRVDNTREALAYAISNACDINYRTMKFIGVTGTNGKTTTATLIYKLLASSGYKVGFIGTGKIVTNGVTLTEDTYSMTTPDPTLLYPSIARMAIDGCRYVVMEVSSHSIALGKIAPIHFEYAIFTNLDNDHLDFHRSKEAYFATKLKLFKNVKTGLFNLDDEYSRRASKLVECNVSTFGIIDQGDAYATEIELKSINESSFYYRADGLIFKASTHLGGAFNVYNTMAALKCVIDLGIKPCIAKRALEQIEGITGRMEVINSDICVIIDYAHTPSAFLNSLKTIKRGIKSKQNLIVVFGCGGDRDKSKRQLFGEYAELIADILIITEDNSRTESFDSIATDIVSGIKKKEFKVIKDRETAIKYAIAHAVNGDVVAVIGKGHEKYKIVGKTYLPFDEREIILKALNERGDQYARIT